MSKLEKNIKVYPLELSNRYEGSELLGVYSTLENAKNAMKDYSAENEIEYSDSFVITKVELDGVALVDYFIPSEIRPFNEYVVIENEIYKKHDGLED